MWTGIILACGQVACNIFVGPVTFSEPECMASIRRGESEISANRPDLVVTDFKCIEWDMNKDASA